MQDLGYGKVVTDPTGSTQLDVEWLELGNLEITKTNIENDLIDGAKFKLTSVSYSGYEEILTISNGKLLIKYSSWYLKATGSKYTRRISYQ